MDADKLKIVVADDDSEIVKIIFRILHPEGYNVITCNDGKFLLPLAKKHSPSLIITDWEMPEMNGIDAIKELRANEPTGHIPILMITGKLTSVENLKLALQTGANDFIRKPFDEVEVIARVNSMVKYYESLKKIIAYEKQLADIKYKVLEEKLQNEREELIKARIRLLKSINQQNKLVDKLNDLEKSLSLSNKSYVEQIVKDFTREAEERWDEYELLFEKVNSKFMEKLLNLHPDLSKNERKLCLFIKSNLSCKDICVISHQSLDAIKKAKYRMKKKMNLDNETDLESYILSF